jgi:hypothetical protein
MKPWNSSNLGKYNKVLSEGKGNPVLFLMPMRTPKVSSGRSPSAKTAL